VDTIQGRYEPEEAVGEGSMGEVLRCRDLQLGRTVAIKKLRLNIDGAIGKAEGIERFRDEAKLAASLNHPNVVAVYDFVSESDELYLVMQYVSGPTLREVVERRGPTSVEDTIRVGRDVAAALAAADEAGIVHRDVKPDNVFLAEDRAMLGDFGLARNHEGPYRTAAHILLGTPNYLAPELVRSVPASAASDVFSLALTLLFARRGADVFSGSDPTAVVYSICTQRVDVEDGFDSECRQLLQSALDHDPSRRPSFAEIADTLDRVVLVERHRALVGAVPASGSPAQPASSSPAPPAQDGSTSAGVFATGTAAGPGPSSSMPTLPAAGALAGEVGSGVAASLPASVGSSEAEDASTSRAAAPLLSALSPRPPTRLRPKLVRYWPWVAAMGAFAAILVVAIVAVSHTGKTSGRGAESSTTKPAGSVTTSGLPQTGAVPSVTTHAVTSSPSSPTSVAPTSVPGPESSGGTSSTEGTSSPPPSSTPPGFPSSDPTPETAPAPPDSTTTTSTEPPATTTTTTSTTTTTTTTTPATTITLPISTTTVTLGLPHP
jgi:eukaryotic-like serine/threonine-protein kinase